MSEAIQIRSLLPADAAGARDIAAQCAQAPHWELWAYETAAQRAQAGQGFALAACLPDRTFAGFALGAVVPPDAELESIVVLPALQRRGVARALLTAAVETARSLGCERMLLEVRESNVPARGLYASYGFVETGRRANYYRDPAEDAVLMEVALWPPHSGTPLPS